ncbi:MAG: glycosyltransferase [Chloroflexota bacterium]|nr:glycosyltransferase [Chloroflexota bacterium]
MSGELADTVVIVPARDEAASIADVVSSLRGLGVARVIVVDDASSDHTAGIEGSRKTRPERTAWLRDK